MTTNYTPNKQICPLETGNGHCLRPSVRPVRMATKNDNHHDGHLNGTSSWSCVCRELNLHTLHVRLTSQHLAT